MAQRAGEYQYYWVGEPSDCPIVVSNNPSGWPPVLASVSDNKKGLPRTTPRKRKADWISGNPGRARKQFP